ncbi:MAG: FecR family protein [Alistipes sp.]
MDDILLLKFLQNTATEAEMLEVLDWLAADPEHKKYLNDLDEVLNASNVWESQLASVPQQKPVHLTPWRIIARWTSAVAAVICIGLGVGFMASKYQMSLITDQKMTIAAPKGQRLSMTLNDGTHVWLNAGSSLTYPPIFSKKERRVNLSGEAIFEVTHDADCPFVVSTFACEAMVLGTKFDIQADEQRGIFAAALMEGRLEITHLANKERITMNPNEIVKLHNGKLCSQELTDRDDYLWPEGIINLKGLSFEDLMVKLELAYNVDIIIKRDKMPVANLSWGKMPISSGIEHTLHVLQCLTDFEYEKNDETGVIIIK